MSSYDQSSLHLWIQGGHYVGEGLHTQGCGVSEAVKSDVPTCA